ncbi:papain-like cysteine protease family protein [Emticicia agri]|uniref:Uncharacterized protein n=1 Tax=Emticicia agri TaxID=2492393 RepID=A0A4Q5LW64_9BACT|nr:papain-like cysteine protease family protein [Emticicia agri]RYU93787.1 hypothetical protein EWM59_20490 [Emticicia agri]
MKYFIIFCFVAMNIQAQVNPIPQLYHNSCWAASLAMVARTIGSSHLDQCFFIKQRCKGSGSQCNCSTSSISDNEMKKFTAKNIKDYTISTSNSLGLSQIINLINSKKPIIYDYKLSGEESHIVVMDGVEGKKMADGKNISWIHISDPWPMKFGNDYFVTYEGYFSKPKINENDINKSRKYTISSDIIPSPALNSNDVSYLNNVLFNGNSKDVINGLLDNIKTSPSIFSNSFYIIINFDKSQASSTGISRGLRIINVGNAGTLIGAVTEPNILLSRDNEATINFLIQNSTIKTAITTVKISNVYNSFDFNNNWIINHIERGDRYKTLLDQAKTLGIDLLAENETDIIFHFRDTYFALLKKDKTYYVFDIYRDGFEKIGADSQEIISGKPIEFKDFVKHLK